MKSSIVLVVAAIVLGACSRNQPKTFSGPANSNGLECALRVASDSGYVPERGGLAQGFVWMQREVGNNAKEVAKEAATRIITLGQKGVNRTTAERLHIIGADEKLRITASSLDEKGKEVDPTDDGERLSRFILRSCAP